MEKENIEQKSIVTGLGLALFLIASTSVLSSWSLVAGFPASRGRPSPRWFRAASHRRRPEPEARRTIAPPRACVRCP